MNILFLDQFSDLGGAQQCLLDLAPAIQMRGWKMICAAPGNGRLVEKLRSAGVTVHSLPAGPLASGKKPVSDFARFGLRAPRLAREISNLARETAADLLYANGPRVLPAAAWVARRTGRPLLFHCHNHLSQRAAAWLAGRSLQLADARVIACCRYAARPLWPYIDPGKLRVIYNGVAAPGIQKRKPQNSLHIGVIGRISPEKGQAEFIAAARLIHAKFPECKFTVFGAPLFEDPEAQAYLDRVRASARDLPVAFPGWQDDVNAALAGLDVLVVPSLREPGAARVVIEAYAAHVPVVAFASGGIPEILHDGETGFLVEPPTPENLAAKLEEILRAPERRCEIAEAACRAWQEQFTLERYQREVVEVIGITQMRLATGRPI